MSEAAQAVSDEQKAVAYLRRALVELNETRKRLQEAEYRATEPIAIVGMGCRYPGGVRSPEDLWELVSAGGDAISELPRDRAWDLEALPGPDREDPTVGFKGGFIDDACEFDAEFFGIDEEAARMMDPQQRLLLETTWEASENAGIDPTALRGTDTGVFVGVGAQGYGLWLLGAAPENAQGHYSLGNTGSMTSGRLAHVLKLEGPAFTIDTACSSSAVALHLACQSLRQRDCSMAVAGGAAIIATPWIYLEFSRQINFGISPDGRCKSFADRADGASFSEGVGVVLLERLSDARRLGHDVLAVVRGSALNQDGVSNGLTAPNGLAHERVIRRALANAGVSAGQVDVVEAHGMGTTLGDPIEAQAMIAAYGRDRDGGRPLWLGSMKSNTGHTQSAGAVGGVIKMVMAMRHGLLPKTLHVDAPSRHVDWSSGAVSLLLEPVPWVKEGDQRRAAVHSFGMSGTNAHIILEEPTPAPPPVANAQQVQPEVAIGRGLPVPWLISGRGAEGLRRQARRLAEFLAERPELAIADVGRSLLSRAQLSHRAFLMGVDREQLLAALQGVGEDRLVAEPVAGQRLGSGAAPMNSSQELAPAIERIDKALSPRRSAGSLRDVLRGAVAKPDTPGVPQLLDSAARLEDSPAQSVLAALGQLWAVGVSVDWGAVFAGCDARVVQLPTYAFDRRRYWVDESPLWVEGGPMLELHRQLEEAPPGAGTVQPSGVE